MGTLKGCEIVIGDWVCRRCKRWSAKQLLEMPCWTLPVFCLSAKSLRSCFGIEGCQCVAIFPGHSVTGGVSRDFRLGLGGGFVQRAGFVAPLGGLPFVLWCGSSYDTNIPTSRAFDEKNTLLSLSCRLPGAASRGTTSTGSPGKGHRFPSPPTFHGQQPQTPWCRMLVWVLGVGRKGKVGRWHTYRCHGDWAKVKGSGILYNNCI